MFKGIYKLPAGYYLRVTRDGRGQGGALLGRGAGQGYRAGYLSRMSEKEQIEFCTHGIMERLDAAVEKRMMSDVPFGVFLSGGVDLPTNVALMSKYTPEPLRTFTVGFKDHEHLNEMGEARLVAERFKTDHHEVLIDEADMLGYLDKLVFSQDEPIADWACIPLYFVSKLAKDNGVTVVQVGEGSTSSSAVMRGYMGYLELYKRYWTPLPAFCARDRCVIWRPWAPRASAATSTAKSMPRHRRLGRQGA